MQKLLKPYAPKKAPISWCGCAGKRRQLAAVAGPASGEGGDNTAAAAAAGSTTPGAAARGAGGAGGVGSGMWFRRLVCFVKCCGTPGDR